MYRHNLRLHCAGKCDFDDFVANGDLDSFDNCKFGGFGELGELVCLPKREIDCLWHISRSLGDALDSCRPGGRFYLAFPE